MAIRYAEAEKKWIVMDRGFSTGQPFQKKSSAEVGKLFGFGLGVFLLACVTCEKRAFTNELCPPLSFRSPWGFACMTKPQQKLAVSVNKTDKTAL